MKTNAQLLLIQSTHRMTIKYDPDISHTYVESINARIPNENGGYIVQTNLQGFRSDIEFESRKKGLPRILMFGDSNTAGDGVSNYQRYSDIIAKKLNVESFNYGLSATGTDQQLLIFRKFAENIEADMVMLFITVHNIERIKVIYWESFERTTGEFVLVPKPYFTLSNQNKLELSHIPVPMKRKPVGHKPENEYLAPFTGGNKYIDPFFKLSKLKKVVAPITSKLNLGIQKKLKKRINFQPHRDYDDPSSQGWQLMEAIIKQFHSEISPLQLMIVPLPTYNYLYEQYVPNYIDRFESLGSLGDKIHVLDLTSQLLNMPLEIRRKMFFKRDSHFSPYGHQIISDLVSTKISDLI